MDSDDESHDVKLRSKHYNALRTDIVAALSAFDRAQDWAVRCEPSSLCFISFLTFVAIFLGPDPRPTKSQSCTQQTSEFGLSTCQEVAS